MARKAEMKASCEASAAMVFVTEDAQRGVEDHILIMEDKAC